MRKWRRCRILADENLTRRKLILFLGVVIFTIYLLVQRNEGTANHQQTGGTPISGIWRSLYPFHANDSLDGESLSLEQMPTYEQRKEARCGHNWQKSYKKLHQDILQARRPQKFIVFTCKEEGYECAGYGNRLGGVTSLLFLSILTQRALLIDWDHGAPLERFLVPKGVQWNYSMENLKHFDSRIHYLGKKEHFKKTRSDVLKPWKTKLDFQAWLRQADLSSYFDHPVEKIVSNWNFANALLEKPFLEKNLNELPRKTNNSLSTFGLTAAELKFHPSQTVTFGHQMMHSKDHCGRVEVPSRTNSYVRTEDYALK